MATTVDRNVGVPLYKQIKSDLMSRIRNGHLSGRIPNEVSLARHYGVARFSIRKAMAELVDEDVLSRRPGRGTFVSGEVRAELKCVHFALHHPLPGEPQPDRTDYPITHDILMGVADGARRRGLKFDVIAADYYHREAFISTLKDMGACDGLIVGAYAPIVEAAAALGVATVMSYVRPEDHPGMHVVTYDYVAAVGLGMRALLDRGARDIALALCGPVDRGGGLAKVAEARATAARYGVSLPPERIISAHSESGLAAMEIERYLRTHPLPDGIFCGKDDVAAGAIEALHRLGVDVPGKVMVVGYSDFPLAAGLNPPLTTVRVPRFDIGLRAVDVLARAIQAGPGCAPIRVVLPPELVVRGTTR